MVILITAAPEPTNNLLVQIEAELEESVLPDPEADNWRWKHQVQSLSVVNMHE
jgi:hypothetical protein